MKFTVLLSVIILSISCKEQQKFDKTAWEEKGDLGIYQNREKMIADLIKNYRLKGLTYQQVVALIGQPEAISNLKAGAYLYYNIVTEYRHDIDPVFTQDLQIELNIDSVVEQVDLVDLKH